MFQWCRQKKTHDILKEDEIINYEDMVAIQTKPIPVVFDGHSSIAHNDYGSPKGRSQRKNTTSDDFDVPMYLTEMPAIKSSGSEVCTTKYDDNDDNDDPSIIGTKIVLSILSQFKYHIIYHIFCKLIARESIRFQYSL